MYLQITKNMGQKEKKKPSKFLNTLLNNFYKHPDEWGMLIANERYFISYLQDFLW